MKIIQIAPLWERVPPAKYGGSELVVSNITEELVKRGHQVVLFATGDSKTKAKLQAIYPHALYRSGIPWDNKLFDILEVAKAVELAEKEKFDIIHNHVLYMGLTFSRISKVPMIHSIHGNLHLKQAGAGKRDIALAFRNANYVSISNTQRKGARELNYVATVYNGIDLKLFDFNPKPRGKYLAFLGRIVDKKGPIEAIKVAKKTGLKLKIAAKVDKVDEEFHNSKIKPLIDGKQIQFIGEVDSIGRNKLLKDAICLLNPIKWEEPFGLVVPEANACGTPVVAFARGGVTETIDDGVNGFLIKPGDIEGMVKAVRNIDKIDRATCRKHVEENFTVKRMVDGYEKVYKKIIKKK